MIWRRTAVYHYMTSLQLLLCTAFEGIAIDRLDYSEFFNYDYDDNVSWVPMSIRASV